MMCDIAITLIGIIWDFIALFSESLGCQVAAALLEITNSILDCGGGIGCGSGGGGGG